MKRTYDTDLYTKKAAYVALFSLGIQFKTGQAEDKKEQI